MPPENMKEYDGVMQNPSNPKEKFGRLKPPLHLIPESATIQESMAMKQGADKYGPFNWRRTPVLASTYIAAVKRHLAAWFDGEEVAPDSGIHHLAHARASLGVVMDAQAVGMMADDRPPTGAAGRMLVQFTHNMTADVWDANLGRSATEAVRASALSPVSPYYTEYEARKDPRKRVRKVYIAGPMRGYDKFNFPAFDAARDAFIADGWDPISPADLDRAAGIDENSPPMDTMGPEINREFVRRDTDALLSMRVEHGDAIAMLPGWEKSTGALAEFFVARWLGLKVLDAITLQPFKTDPNVWAFNTHEIYGAIQAYLEKK